MLRIPVRIQSIFLLLVYASYILVPVVHDCLHADENASILATHSRIVARFTADCAGSCGDPTHHHDRVTHHGTCVLCATQIKTPHRILSSSPPVALTYPCGAVIDLSDTFPTAFFLRVHSIRGPPQTFV